MLRMYTYVYARMHPRVDTRETHDSHHMTPTKLRVSVDFYLCRQQLPFLRHQMTVFLKHVHPQLHANTFGKVTGFMVEYKSIINS